MNSSHREPLVDTVEKPTDRHIERLTDLLDTRYRIPGTPVRFGIDSLIGLIPYVGDVFSMAISGYLVSLMAAKGASGKVVLKMIGNLIVDTLIGAIPVLGDIFDFGYKANRRNLRLYKEYHDEGKHSGSAKPWIWLIVVVIVLLFAFLIWLLYSLFQLIF